MSLDPNNAIKIEKVIYSDGNPRIRYFYNCKKCSKEIHYTKAELNRVSGYCYKCSSKIIHTKPKENLSEKYCPSCERTLSIFHFGKTGSDHYRKICQKCSNLKQMFKITGKEYYLLLEKQNFVCKICKNKPGKLSLAVDHDHKTGKIRGLLCGSCNPGLGSFKDNIELLKQAIYYLEENNENKN